MARDKGAALLVPLKAADLRLSLLHAQVCLLVYAPEPDGFVTRTASRGNYSCLPRTPGDGLDGSPVLHILADRPMLADVPDGDHVVIGARGHVHALVLGDQGADFAPVGTKFIDDSLLNSEIVDQYSLVLGARVEGVLRVEAEGRHSLLVLMDLPHQPPSL